MSARAVSGVQQEQSIWSQIGNGIRVGTAGFVAVTVGTVGGTLAGIGTGVVTCVAIPIIATGLMYMNPKDKYQIAPAIVGYSTIPVAFGLGAFTSAATSQGITEAILEYLI